MTRFLKLVRQNGSWQALPTETYDLALDSQLKKDDAPIDPVQLLRALAPLLSVDGGINGIDKTPQLASLMKKFSRKLVSRCVYCNVLKATSTEILAKFLEDGGWNTINTWLNDAKENNNQHFLLEIIQLCDVLPMTLERLKENNTAKVVKALTKLDNKEIQTLSNELVTKWMNIIKPPVETVKKKRKSSKDGEKDPKEQKKIPKLKDKESPVKEKKDLKKTTKAPVPHKSEKKPVKINHVQNTEKASRTIEKEVPSKKPGKIKNNKRPSSEKSTKPEAGVEEKVKPEEPVPKKLKLERPKTVKSFTAKFRATGLEQEAPLPKKIQKKTATVDKTAAVAAAKSAVVKKLNTTPAERITEKKIKPESLLTINESSNASGGIKLIPAKPQPAHILHESTSFMDALVAAPAAVLKRKKKPVTKPASSPTTPTSPTMKPPKLQFYKETLELNTEENKDTKVQKTEDEDETKNTEEKDSPSSPITMAEITEPKIVVNEESKEEPAEEETAKSSVPNSIEKDDDSKGSSDVKDELAEEDRDPNALRSILAHGKRRQKRKNVRWVKDTELKEIFYFELDETERVNVLKNRAFGDLKSLDSKREREAFEAAKRHAGDKMEESTMWWVIPIYIDTPPPLVVPGCYSQEKEIQHLRQQSVLQEIYFTREMVPDSPYEPELELTGHVEPKIIPLDEGNTVGSLLDYSAKEIPKPKSLLPEVLTSLIKIPSLPIAVPTLAQMTQDPFIVSQQLSNTSPASPYDPGEPVSPGLLGPPPVASGPMFTMQPPLRQEPDVIGGPTWAPMESSMIRTNERPFFPNFQMNHNVMMDRMPLNPPGGANGDLRMRMPPPVREPYRPNVPRGASYPTNRHGGSRNRRTVPCRHFLANGCRFGNNCSFLHPGVNGPPL